MASYFGTNCIRRHRKGKTNLDFNESRDDAVVVASAGPHANNLYLTPDRSPRQHLITHFFTDLDALPDAYPTSKITKGQ